MRRSIAIGVVMLVTLGVVGAGVLAGYDYVIVMEEKMFPVITEFYQWKQSLGHNVATVTPTWLAEHGYPAADQTGDGVLNADDVDEDDIWQFLHDKYFEWGIEYILLIGSFNAIPAKQLYWSQKPSVWPVPHSDHFYALLTRSGYHIPAEVWNKDGDSRWGELVDDVVPAGWDAYVGRIPFDDPAVVKSVLNVSKTFESSPMWMRALLVGVQRDITKNSVSDSAVKMEQLYSDVLGPKGWTTVRVYEKAPAHPSIHAGVASYDLCPRGSCTSILDAWNSKEFGLVLMGGHHGNCGGVYSRFWNDDGDGIPELYVDVVDMYIFAADDVSKLTGTYPSIVGLFGCNTIEMPCSEETYSYNTGQRLLYEGKASGVVAWYHFSGGDDFIYHLGKNVVNRQTLGEAVFHTKADVWNQYPEGHVLRDVSHFWSFNLLGDPALRLH